MVATATPKDSPRLVHIKTGDYIGTSALIEYLAEAGKSYGLPRLARVDHPNKLTTLRENHNFPDPSFHFSGRDAWLLPVVDRWIETQRAREVKVVLESTKSLTPEMQQALYRELGKQIKATDGKN